MSPRLAGLAVSRETEDRLDAFVSLLQKWNRRINLIGRSTADDIWSRHVSDSARLLALAPAEALRWLDLGSGAGFPGMVLAVLLAELRPAARMTLVDSDERKCAFLAEAARVTGIAVDIRNARIEALPPQGAEVVTARALAPLTDLLELSVRHRAPGGVLLFPKGQNAQSELTAARRFWHIEVETIPAGPGQGSDQQGVTFRVGEASRV